jgi:filamentous hemagglutinin family protein
MKVALQAAPIVLLLAVPAQAQITAAPNDAGTIVQPRGTTIDITGGTIGDRNLFHSFQRFGLDANQTANFLANPAIQNILGRVVGGDASVINGRIQVTGGNPNLYLINPAGIVFGPGASLNVPGSFGATTANGIGFGNQWLNAIGSNNYAALTGDPSQFAFTTTGAIVNRGNLAVQPGQNLLLLGGTVVSTGTLTAPGGSVTIAAIPNEKLVRITQAGNLLSLDLPVADRVALNPLPRLPVSLPELLTIGGGSEVTVQPGDVMATAIVAESATVQASHNLTLPSSQIQTTGDVRLVAGNTVQVQDSPTAATVVQSGGSLQIQGHQVNLAILTHADSRLESGRDMVIRGEAIVGDAHYYAGGNLRFERLDGSAGTVSSPHDPVILAIGDVTLGDYTGASLHILAGGSVVLGNVTIDAVGAPNQTINPTNATPLNGSRSLGSLARITRADGSPLLVNVRPTLDSAGNIQRISTGAEQLEIDGSTKTTLDVRAGVNWASLGGLGGNATIGPVATAPNFLPVNPPTGRADVTIASIQVNRPGNQPGMVLLTNQYVPTLAPGSIQVSGNFRVTDATSGSGAANTVVIDSKGSIATGDILSRRGSVDLRAIDNITAGLINASGLDFLGDDSVVLAARAGNIQVATISAGANGVDVRAGGLVRFTETRSSLGLDPAPGIIKPGTELGDFLIAKGYAPQPDLSVPVDFFAGAPNASIVSRPANRGAGVLNAPISIAYGDASSLILDQTFPVIRGGSGIGNPNTASVGRIVIRGGGAGFYSVPRFDEVVPGAGPFITTSGGVGAAIPAVPPGTATPPPTLRRNATNFQPGDLPAGVSGSVGIFAISSGDDSGFYGSTVSIQFSPPPVPPGGGGSGGGGGTPAPSVSTQEGQVAQRDLNKPAQTATCVTPAPGPIAAAPTPDTRSPQPPRPTTPCTLNPADDAQILKILEDAPAPERIKSLDFDRSP